MSKQEDSSTKGQQILVFGEDRTDREAIATLVRGLRPDLRVKFTPLKQPITLVRGMRPENAKSRNERTVKAIKAANVRASVIATLLHEDADAVEPAHLQLIRGKESALSDAPGEIVAVVPAWEIETWWLMFPDCVAALHGSWTRFEKHVGKNVGKIQNSKEELQKLVRQTASKGSKSPEYSEQDSPKIAKEIVDSGKIGKPEAKSESWSVFVHRISSMTTA